MPESDSIRLMQQQGDSEVAATRVALCEHLALYTQPQPNSHLNGKHVLL